MQIFMLEILNICSFRCLVYLASKSSQTNRLIVIGVLRISWGAVVYPPAADFCKPIIRYCERTFKNRALNSINNRPVLPLILAK